MEFKSSPQIGKAIAIFLGATTFVMLYFTTKMPDGMGGIFFMLAVLPGFLGTAAALTARYVIVFDKHQGQVIKRFQIFSYKRENTWRLADFTGIGIGIGGRGGTPSPTTVYFLQLLGRENLKVSMVSDDLEYMRREAKKLGDFIGLTIDEQPRTVFFGKRW